MTIKGLSGFEITVIGACHYGVGLDSEKSIFSEKMGKEAIRYGKSVYDIKEFRYFIGIRIWQYDKLNIK